MASKSYLCFFFFFLFTGLASPDVGTGSGKCSLPGALDCRLQEAVASGEEDGGSLTLLQQHQFAKSVDGTGALKPKTKTANEEDVWEQLTAACNLDSLKKELKKAKKASKKGGSKLVDDLQSKYDELSEAFPDAKQIKNKFHKQWGSIKKSVNMESMQKEVQKAKDAGSDMVGALQDKYDKLSTKFKDVNVEDIKKDAQKQWNKLADKLPDMDHLKKKAQKAAKKFGDTAEQLSAKATSAYGDFSASVAEKLDDLDLSDKVSDLKDQASDAVGDLTDQVSDAADAATDALKKSPLGGLFR